jgi:hypothetical protein
MQPAATILAALASLCLAVGAHARDPATPSPEAIEELEAAEVEEEEEELEEAEFSDLRERLTEREDENRVEDPWTTDLWGHPLTLAGEAEVFVGFVEELSLGEPDEDYDRLILESEVEAELFYSMGTPFSLFLQARLIDLRDLHSQTPDRISEFLVERGEMWIYSEDILETGLSFEVGSLDFEDDRLWWWDEERDAVRVGYETETFEATLSVARELFSRRTSQSFVDPEDDEVLRLIGEVSWDWRRHHALELFALHQDDLSDKDRPGQGARARGHLRILARYRRGLGRRADRRVRRAAR